MKKIDRYIYINMLKISIAAIAMITLLLVLVFLFINFQRFSSLKISQTAYLLGLKTPSLLSLIAGPAVLFSTTYFVSSLYSNNEFISLLSAGISYLRIIKPIIILALIFTGFFFFFNEEIKTKCDIKYDEKMAEFTSQNSYQYKNDGRNIAITDPESKITVRAGRYYDSDQRLENINIATFKENGNLDKKIHAEEAWWDDMENIWKIRNANTYEIGKENMEINANFERSMILKTFTIAPSFFKSKGEDIRTMDLREASDYLKELKKVQKATYYEKATEFYTRIFESVIVLIMMIVSLSINLHNKRNAMMFSLISSLAIAVVYYAINMATTLLAKQGMMNPLFAILLPVAVILSLAVFGIAKVST